MVADMAKELQREYTLRAKELNASVAESDPMADVEARIKRLKKRLKGRRPGHAQ
jgi:hypothetical protein